MTAIDGGVHIAVLSRDADFIEICFFDDQDRETSRHRLAARSGDIHHGFVAGIGPGTRYGLRAHGPFRPHEGLRFDPSKLLVDPWARRLAPYPTTLDPIPAAGLDDLSCDGLDSAAFVPKAVIEEIALPTQRPPRPQPAARVIYELHARGFSMRHPAIPPSLRGTVGALAHEASIAHFKRLGVTTIEIMPLAAGWNERHLAPLGLSNYWGYNPLAFLAPDPRLAPGGMAEVAATVDALHAAGLEVILDVVFNHTAESDERGRTLSLRGIDNRTFYRLTADPRFYVNDTGCGNTLALDRPEPMRLVMDALRHWASVGGFDGFRFDLAPVLGRQENGFSAEAPLLAMIEQDPILCDRVMIAEPWDIGPGGYRLGGFPARWLEWNDRARDDIRRFWRGDGSIGALATRLAGSSDIFAGRHRRPSASVNFIAAHDGFTLHDVVRHATKRNEANGEGNRDGHAGEVSWVAADPVADTRALLATLLFARGTPMLGMGDELGRTQRGNNNAYAQDNDTTWIDWSRADETLIDFVGQLIAARKATPALTADRFLTGEGDVVWLGADGLPLSVAGWESGARVLGMMLGGAAASDSAVLAWFNADGNSCHVRLPEAAAGHVWRASLGSAETFAAFDLLEIAPRSVSLLTTSPGRVKPRSSGVPDALTNRLADLAGIAPEWWQVDGTHQRVSLETRRALLAAMGFSTRTADEAHDSLERLLAAHGGEVATTSACHLPAVLPRRIGVAAQLYALRRAGDQGIGDFTTLRMLAEKAAERGLATIALNPFHAGFPSDRNRASPYQPSDRRFLDALMIDLDAVPEIGAARALLAAEAGEIAALRASRMIDRTAVWRIKRAALRAAFAAFEHADAARQASFAAFRRAGGRDLERFCLFQALEEEAGHPPATLPDRAPEHLRSGVDFAAWLQFIADEQLASAAEAQLSIGLYRDLAVGPSPDGAEVVASPGMFMNGVTVGAPPDPFSATGQVWNLPPLDPFALRRTGFAAWRSLLRANMRHAGALRIDHAMALRRLFLIPQGASPSEGTYVRYPMEGMIAALAEESRAARCLIVGEDLGTVPEGFRERLAAANILSCRVLFFERDGSGFLQPERYPPLAVASVATHDLPPLAAWWNSADLALEERLGRPVSPRASLERSADRRALADLAGLPDDSERPEMAPALHALIARTPCALALVQAEELCGEQEPVNVPGTSEAEYPNWRRRLVEPVETLLDGATARATLAAMRDQRPD